MTRETAPNHIRMTDEVLWAEVGALATAVSALFAAASAAFAGLQILYSRRESARRATLEQLREIDSRLQPIWEIDTGDARRDVLSWYRHQGQLSDQAAKYLSFLNALDMLAFAYGRDVLDRKMTDDYIDTLLRTDVVTRSFLIELQECCKDNKVYEHLSELIVQHGNARRSLKEKSSRTLLSWFPSRDAK